MSRLGRSSTCATIQPLTRREIERRIHEVLAEVTSPSEPGCGSTVGADDLRWIAPSDLVRRMRAHLVFN